MKKGTKSLCRTTLITIVLSALMFSILLFLISICNNRADRTELGVGINLIKSK